MITSIPERHSYALKAIEDFQAQDWPHKELVVINSSGVPLPKRAGMFEVFARNTDPHLNGFGLSQCHGEWVADWQDDCRYSPRYLRAMARLRSKQRPVRLMFYSGVCVDDQTQVNVDNDGSMFSLSFRFNFNPTDPPIWLDSCGLATRYYASKGEAV